MNILILKIVFVILCISFQLVLAKGVVSYQHYQRLNTPSNKSVSDNWIGFEYEKKRSHKGRFDSEFELNVRHFNGNKSTVGSVPVANFQYERSRTKTIYGRQILDWNKNEKFWGLGVLNPNRGFNLLEENQEGLTGISLDRKTNFLRVTLFASYFYIPQLNPGYKIEDGKITSQTEWSKPVPANVSWRNANIPIRYELEDPSINEVIFQETFGGRIGYEWSSGLASAYVLYKPESQVRLNATGYYEQDVTEQAFVRAKPFVNHHWLYGGQLTQNIGDNEINFGSLYLEPKKVGDEDFEFEPLRIEPVYENEGYAYLQWNYDNKYSGFSLNYIKLLTQHANDGNVFSVKPRWNNAIGISGFWDVSDNIKLKAKYSYDIDMLDHVFTATSSLYLMKKKAVVTIGAEILQAPSANSFWSPFRSNDSFYSNFSYTF